MSTKVILTADPAPVKLFGKWVYDDVTINDISLQVKNANIE
jgi:hypothetical protein